MSGDPVTVPAARQGTDGSTTVADPPEIRRIVVAQGIQANNANFERDAANVAHDYPALTSSEQAQVAEMHRSMICPQALTASFPDLVVIPWGGDVWGLYYSAAQHVAYWIRVVNDKVKFFDALVTPGVMVVYDGHARYGRGPCFGPDDAPGEDWGNGTNPYSRGLFRMGFPFLGVPVHEVLEHGYTPEPLDATAPRPAAADCDPDLRPHLASLRARTVAEMHPDPAEVARLAHFLGTGDPLASTSFWTYDAYEEGQLECHLVLRAGWEHTPSAPSDLGATDVRCRAFLHLGCSSFSHNYRVVRRLKGWVRDDTTHDRYAYWTSSVSNGICLNTLLRNFLAYPHPSANQPWDEWLRWAVRQTNRDLRNRRQTYHLI